MTNIVDYLDNYYEYDDDTSHVDGIPIGDWRKRPDSPINGYNPSNRIVLLLGTSQNGKSLLGNYLINGEATIAPFPTGTGHKSCTYECQAHSTKFTEIYLGKLYKSQHLILDTPGLGDTKDSDDLIELHVVQYLSDLYSKGFRVGLILIVMRYPCLLTPSYLNNLKMYRRILGKHLEDNLQLVFTDCNAQKLKTQQRMNQNPELNILESAKIIAASLNIALDRVPVLHIDSFPEDKIDVKRARDVRASILSRSLTTREMSLSEQLPKSIKWTLEDEQRIDTIKSERNALLTGLGAFDTQIDQMKAELEGLENAIREHTVSIAVERLWLSEYNKDEKYQTIFNQTFEIKNKRFLPWLASYEDKFIHVSHPIVKVEVDGTKPEQVGYEDKGKIITLKLSSRYFWLTGVVSVRVMTEYRDYYGADIRRHQDLLSEKNRTIEVFLNHKSRMSEGMKLALNDKEDMQHQLAEMEAEMVTLSKPLLSISEFEDRCKENGRKLMPRVFCPADFDPKIIVRQASPSKK
jgi:hypothetical protein